VQYQRLGLSHLGRALLDHEFAATPTSTHNIACKPLPYVFASLGLLPHEAPERGAERLRIKLAEQAAERVVARHPVGQRQDAAQERLLGLRKQRHVHRTLPAAQHRAQRDEQKLVEVMQAGVAGPRVVQLVPARRKPIQGTTPMHNQRPKR